MYPLITFSSFAVRFRNDVTAQKTGNGRISLSRNGGNIQEAPDTPLIHRLMESWLTEEALDELAQSADDPPAFYFLCETLFSLGLLQTQYRIDEQPLFSFFPTPNRHSWREEMPPSSWKLSPYACLHRTGRDFLLEMPLSQRKCIIHDKKCLVWLMEIAREEPPSPSDDLGRTAFYRALHLMGALVQDEPASAVWEFHDLFFFHHSSIDFSDDPSGATWRLKGKLPPEPLFKPCLETCLSLPEPDEDLVKKLSAPFRDVLAHRRSVRLAGNRPITLGEIGALLHASARVQGLLDDPDRPCPGSLRASPSGGAMHSLEIYLLVNRCRGLASGAWRYDPAGHRLDSVAANGALLDAYLMKNPHALIQNAGLPHIHLLITSRFLRDSWKYEKIAYRLVLQDLGCLFQTLSLASTALGLSSCILGAVEARHLAEILNLDPLIEPVIGEMTLSALHGLSIG